MNDDNNILVDGFRRLIADTVTPARVREVEETLSPASLWEALHASGFLDMLVLEDAGGAGLMLPDIFPLLLVLGEYAVPVPFAETMVARGMLSARGVSAPEDALIVLAPASATLPFGKLVTHALVARDDGLHLVEAQGKGDDIFGAAGALGLTSGASVGRVPGSSDDLMIGAAAVASAQMAGAMSRMLEMTLRHAGERAQFGRPLGKFQAIQQQIAVLAEQVISCQVAARTAFSGTSFDPVRVAAAKCRAGEASNLVCGISHAVHGAIGATAEFDLQLYSRRLKQWQLAFGSQQYWATRLGMARAAPGNPNTADFLRRNLAWEIVS